MIFNLGADGYQKDKKPPSFTTDLVLGTGYLYAEEVKSDGTYNWELAILSSGSITFHRVVPVDIFLVGGGAQGGKGYPSPNDSSACVGGSGGAGGQRQLRSNISLTEGSTYSLVIGGSNGSTTGFGIEAITGGGSRGGTGGTAWSSGRSAPGAGSDGTVAFHNHATETDLSLITSLVGRKYGAGGGGAQARSADYVSSYGGSVDGGATGGGKGGSDPTTSAGRPGAKGADNCGAGGGGSCGDRATGTYVNGGAGGSGIIIIRNAR